MGPKPENMEWHNMGVSYGKKIRQGVISFLVLAVCLVISFAVAVVLDVI